MKEWDVFTLALLNFHRTSEKENAAVENSRTPFRKKCLAFDNNKRLGSIRAAGGCVMMDLFFRTPRKEKRRALEKGGKSCYLNCGPS